MTRFLLAALVVAPALATAAPTTVAHQGRLLDAEGMPLQGSHSIQFRLWDLSEVSQVWTETHTVQVSDGYFHTVLGNVVPLDASVLADDDLAVGYEIDSGGELPTRIPLNSVPFAVVAHSVSGGSVDASEVTVGGVVAIASDGTVRDTLEQLSCTDGQVASWNSTASAWECGGVVQTVGGGMHELALGGSTSLDTSFSHEIYTCGGSHVVHVEAAITHWSKEYRAIADKYFYLDSYLTISADTLLDSGTSQAGSWSFQRLVTGNNGSGDTSNRMRITHNAGTYSGGANYYIFIRSTCPIYEF